MPYWVYVYNSIFYQWNILQLQSKYAVFIFRQQHDWQPKGEQKKTGGQSWQGLPPNISSSTLTSPSYGQPMVNSQSNMTTQSTMINSQQPPVNIDPLLSCSMLSPHPHLLPPLLTRWSPGSMVSLPGLCGLSRCAALMLKSRKTPSYRYSKGRDSVTPNLFLQSVNSGWASWWQVKKIVLPFFIGAASFCLYNYNIKQSI